jgi:hypothetical protein
MLTNGPFCCCVKGIVLLEAESRFRRIQAYAQLPVLLHGLTSTLDKQEAVA